MLKVCIYVKRTMKKDKLTAEVRLYRWLKRKTTPEDAWRTMSLHQIAEKVKCSPSTVSRLLPGVVSQLLGCSLDEARRRCIDAHHLRSGRLVSEEIEILKKLRTQDPPASYFTCAGIFGVSSSTIQRYCKKLGLGGSGTPYYKSDVVLPDDVTERLKTHKKIRREAADKRCSAKLERQFDALSQRLWR